VNAGFGIRLVGGPGDGQRFHEHDFLERIRAAQRMGRTDPVGDPAAWALGYLRTGAAEWHWKGVNCYPDPIDDDG
jgi:hypothetical protein